MFYLKKFLSICAIVSLAVITIVFLGVRNSSVFAQSSPQTAAPAPTPPVQIQLTSPAFEENATIPSDYTCLAQDKARSPQLNWSGAPKETVSFVLLVHDLDPHPNKSKDDVLHWAVWNIAGDATSLPEQAISGTSDIGGGARQGYNQRGKIGWAPPCPPVGQTPHHYTFELFALDTKLTLDDKASRQEITSAMDSHVLGHGVLIGRFSRK